MVATAYNMRYGSANTDDVAFGTAAALAGVAAHMRAGQTQLLAQHLDEQRTAFDFDAVTLAIHRQVDLRHRFPPRFRYP